MQKHKVWDIPIRLCHWAIVLLIIFQYLSAEILDDSILPNPIQWHFYAGYTILGLVIFRICWGLFGTYYAKFKNFIVGPKTTFNYLFQNSKNEGRTTTYLGHNPAGALSVIALLSLIITQAISGLFITDDIFHDGPYYGVLSDSMQDTMNFIHHNAFNVLLGFIAFHIAAIIFYKIVKKQSLTSAMITGYKKQADSTNSNFVNKNNNPSSFPWIGFILSLIITGIILYVILIALVPPPTDDYYY